MISETATVATDIWTTIVTYFSTAAIWVLALYAIIALVVILTPAVMSSIIHKRKGYFGGFFVGLFFGALGVLYAAGLPDKKLRQALTGSKLDEN